MPSSQDDPPDMRFERSSSFDSLEEIVEGAQRFSELVFEDEEVAHRFVLAVSEAVANAIEHGNAADPEKKIVVEFRVREERVEAAVADQGRGFDPSAIENPLEERNLLRTHGRGLHIIRQVVDELTYESEGRCVRMSFRRRA